MFAVIESGGKQYKVQPGSVIFVEKLPAEEGQHIEFPVISHFGEGKISVGTPYLSTVKVSGTVQRQGKSKKLTVFTFKNKGGHHRKLGHRQPYTKVQIEEIRA